MKLVGRIKEQEVLNKLLQSSDPEMVAVVGRRRVGKTFLIRNVYERQLDFELTGIQHASQSRQLNSFLAQLKIAFGKNVATKRPSNWIDAFYLLIEALEAKNKQEKIVVFFDELSWLATNKSGFLEALGFFWNTWASRKNIVVVICGSAASWMIRKVVNHKGGLHNRITKRIDLQAFSLYETEIFLHSRGIFPERYQTLQLYMAMGGIPHYLKEIEGGKSAIQNIDDICFTSGGLLYDEFDKLYPALFEHSENHIAIIRALSQKWKGMTRQALINISQISDGGGFSKMLKELISCGFITAYFPFGKQKREKLYRLTDEYSLFYLHFIEKQKNQGNDIWKEISQTPKWASWSGYAFESICIKHLSQIKKALSISGIYAEASGFLQKGNEEKSGIQIDLVLDRKDQVINLFEMKFYAAPWAITKAEALELRERVALFKSFSQTRKQVFLSVITTFGLKKNEYILGLVDNELTMEALFMPD